MRTRRLGSTLVVYAGLLLVLTSVACQGDDAGSTEAAQAATTEPAMDVVTGEHTFEAADGVSFPYVVSGAGDTTVVLVHCWMCDRTFWENQIPVLEENYRVVALDLPGHGAGGDDRELWTIDAFGQDVAGLIEHLDLNDVILVGHSMGGPVSLRAAALAQGRVRGIVAVDTLHDADFDASVMAPMVEMFKSDFRNACSGMVGQMFVEENVDPVIAHVRKTGCEESNEVAGKSLMEDFSRIDAPTLFKEAGVPIRAINASGPNPTRVENNRKYADFDAVYMDNVGHYLQMTRPEEFNRLLLETLAAMPEAHQGA